MNFLEKSSDKKQTLFGKGSNSQKKFIIFYLKYNKCQDVKTIMIASTLVKSLLGLGISATGWNVSVGLRDVWLHHLYAGGLLTKMYKNVSELDIIEN